MKKNSQETNIIAQLEKEIESLETGSKNMHYMDGEKWAIDSSIEILKRWLAREKERVE